MENELLKSVTFSVVQRALAQIAAGLAVGGWISEDDSQQLILVVAGILGSGIIYAWTYFQNKAAQKLQNRQIEIALVSTSMTPVSLVKAKAAEEVKAASEVK